MEEKYRKGDKTFLDCLLEGGFGEVRNQRFLREYGEDGSRTYVALDYQREDEKGDLDFEVTVLFEGETEVENTGMGNCLTDYMAILSETVGEEPEEFVLKDRSDYHIIPVNSE